MTRLSAFWFVYMAGLGLVYPFQAVWYQESAGLTGWQLGLVLALRPIMGIAGQPFFGRVADRSGQRARTLAFVLTGAGIAYFALPWAPDIWALVAVAAVAAFFGTSVMPLGTSVSMAALGSEASQRFGSVRVWGTVGYAIVLFAFPRLLDVWREREGVVEASGEPGLGAIFMGMAVFCLLAAAVVARVPITGQAASRSQRGDVALLLRHRPYRVLLVITFLGHGLLQGPIQFFPLLVAERGGDLTDVSNLWLPMLAMETLLVAYSSRGAARFGPKRLICAGIAADGLRWILTLLAPTLGWMILPQLLHGVVIAGFLIGTALYVEQVTPDRLRSTGQAGLAMVGVSCATAFSNLWVGLFVDLWGIQAAFWVGGAGGMLLGAAALVWLPRPQKMTQVPEGPDDMV